MAGWERMLLAVVRTRSTRRIISHYTKYLSGYKLLTRGNAARNAT